MPVEFVEADLKTEMALLARMLGDVRVRFHHRETQPGSLEELTDADLKIRSALARPLSAELQLEVRRLTKLLRALDPH